MPSVSDQSNIIADPQQQQSLPDEASKVISMARSIVDVEVEALENLKANLDADFLNAVELIEACSGRVVVTGMGKSGLIGKKIAATLSSTGTPSYFLHPAEGSHGDLGVLRKDDVIIAISNSGETPEILSILPVVKRFGLPLISMTGNAESTLRTQGDVFLNISVQQEACPLNLAPTASTTATLAMGDALAVVLLERRGFTKDDFAIFHPAGSLGKRLLIAVSDLMLSGDDLPLVSPEMPFMDALLEMSRKKLGLLIVQDENQKLLGLITDGDLRRVLTGYDNPKSVSLPDVMTTTPKTIGAEELAEKALRLMEDNKITSLLVTDANDQLQGVVNMHGILQTGIR